MGKITSHEVEQKVGEIHFDDLKFVFSYGKMP